MMKKVILPFGKKSGRSSLSSVVMFLVSSINYFFNLALNEDYKKGAVTK
jgi:hypothetical protein